MRDGLKGDQRTISHWKWHDGEVGCMVADLELGELRSDFLPDPVPFAVLTPQADGGPFPLCLFLHGGGGSRQSLVECTPLFEAWWSDGSMPPMVLASPSAGMSYYLEHPESGVRWESFIAESFLDHLRARCRVRVDRASTVIIGMSMGGYGALKTAFARPDRFAAVAALSAVLEPGLHDQEIKARNRLHHGAGGPDVLVGPKRDGAVFEANQPADQVITNAERIRRHDLAIYIEAGDHDFINVHDGAEFLHRILWSLDISHEYRLTRAADHVGPTMIPRMRDAFVWLGSFLTARPEPEDHTVTDWIERGMDGPPPKVAPTTDDCIRVLRAQLQAVRNQAAAADPTTDRRYGVLPDTGRR